ncbi:MAG: hypothetical protein OXU26_14170 [Acidobacteriota bacterium]|nr:hypothetical protein [Acidobacteriota bacterium]MDE2965050.1 hypothetical protein [Acidobacteriota bacterium]
MVWLALTCILISLAAAIYVFRPLLSTAGSPFLVDIDSRSTGLKRLLRRKETIYENIKDLDFEYKMGKLSDEDYQRLHQDYLAEAYGVVSQIEAIQPGPLDRTGSPQVVAVLKSGKRPGKSRKP